MGSHSFRSGVVLILLFATLALAVPIVSRSIDGWLFSEDQPAKSRWNSQRPTDGASPEPLRPANPKLIPVSSPKRAETAVSHEAEIERADFAFDHRNSDAGNGLRRANEVQLTEFLQPVPDEPRPVSAKNHAAQGTAVAMLERQLQDLGAAYLAVERAHGDAPYECRALFPLAPESTYQKAFSANGPTPEQAMEQVLAQAKAWKRAASGRVH